MKTEIIKAIFTNILFVMGVGFAIYGFINGTLTVTRMLVFEKYPLESWAETRCDIDMLPYAVKEGTDVQLPQEDLDRKQAQCRQTLEEQRNIRKTENIVSSISALMVGVVLILSFKRFIFSKPENNS
jgi:hypothetical protein